MDLDIDSCLRVIRRQVVMLDADLARLYAVPKRQLNQAVKRNRRRFPRDFFFQLTRAELQHVDAPPPDRQRGGQRYRPYAFTEQGTGMLASVLRTPIATRISIAILRAFARARTNGQPAEPEARNASQLFAAIRDA